MVSSEKAARFAARQARQAVLKSLIYSDIFDFPLTKEEIWKFLISGKRIKRASFEKALKSLLTTSIICRNSYYCLRRREEIIERRTKNLQEVEEKIKIAKRAALYLSYIPSILFIGISGGLAAGDAGSGDDIDFFIITRKDALFKTRFWVLILLEMLGVRRKRLDKNPANKICVNFLIDERKIIFPPDRQDLYTAHEILQLNPLFVRDNIYGKFLESNEWIKKFLPNSEFPERKSISDAKESKPGVVGLLIYNLFPEWLLRKLQVMLIKRHKKREVITKQVLIFNPNDYRVQTLKILRLKFQQLGLLTKD